MKLSSRALNRLRELYHAVFVKNRNANQQCFAYPDTLHRDSAMAIMEALEPRLLLSTTPMLLGLANVQFAGSDAAETLYLRASGDLLEYSHSGTEGSYSGDLDLVTAGAQTLTISPETLIWADLGAGDDRLVVDASLNDILTGGGMLAYSGGVGQDSLFGPAPCLRPSNPWARFDSLHRHLMPNVQELWLPWSPTSRCRRRLPAVIETWFSVT